MRLRPLTIHAALTLLLVLSRGQTGLASQPVFQTDLHYPIPRVMTGAPPEGRISGVVNDDNNKAIKAATVTAKNSDINQTLTATTDDKGRFLFIGLQSGTWRFAAQAPGYVAVEGFLPIHAGSPNPPIAFALTKTEPRGDGLDRIAANDLQRDLNAADALFNQGKWDEAVTAYKAILAKAPTLSLIDLQIAAAYINKKDYEAAIAAYTELLTINPNNDQATVGIARANLERGDPDAAEAGLAKAAEHPSAGRDVFYNLGNIVFDKGDAERAMTWYQKAADKDPSWGKAWYKLGLAAQKKGDKAAAEQFLKTVLIVDPISPEAAMAKAALDQLNR